MHEASNEETEAILLLRKNIPPIVKPTAEEIERRREVVQRMERLRERVGPIGIRADDLLHASRAESE